MVLDEATRALIEKNRLEALKRLEERRRRLEQVHTIKNNTPPPVNTHSAAPQNYSDRMVSSLIPTAHGTLPIKRSAPSESSNDTSLKPLPKSESAKTTSLVSKEQVGCGIRPQVQLASSTTFTITATASVQRICRQIINEVTFNRNENTYTAPLNRYSYLIENLAANERPQNQYQIPKTVLSAFDPGPMAQRKAADSANYDIEKMIGSDLYNSLFPYQREGVKRAIARRGKILFADEMGLGKSIQALSTTVYYRREWPLLILAPASMVASWHQQILRWIPESILSPSQIQTIYDGKVQSLDGTVVILSYDLAVKLSNLIQSKNFRVIIADECHSLRNHETKRSKILVPIICASERALLLSGTPALSRPIELYAQIQCINPKLYPKRHDYALRYCEAHKNYFGGWDMRGSANMTELQVVLENCVMIRRLKDQVLTELPPKIRRQVFLKLPTTSKNFKMFQMQTAEYLGGFEMEGLSEAESVALLESMQKKAEFMALWKRTAEIKLEAMIEYVEDLLEADHKMLIFAHHTSILDGFAQNFISKKVKYIRIDGKTPPNQRHDLCTSFQNDDEIRLALLSITAASTGLTLTKATTVIFSELFFNPGVLVQAEDRAHRIGQIDSVNVHYLLAKGTTDDHIWPLILKKLNILESFGLGKNDFKDIATRDHDNAQLTIDKFFQKSDRPTAAKEEEKNEFDNLVFDLTED